MRQQKPIGKKILQNIHNQHKQLDEDMVKYFQLLNNKQWDQ